MSPHSPRLRRLFGAAVLIGGLAWVGAGLFRDVPRETTVVFVVPRKPAHIGGARFVYALGGDPVARVAFHEPDGLPSRLVHRVTLPVGRITIAASLSDPSGRPITKVERSFQVPAQGDVRVDLGSKGTAHAGVGSAVAAPASGDAP